MIKLCITKPWKLFYIIMFVYIISSFIFLTRFPFVHSDEAWLSGLSRNIMEHHDFSVTETFFDLNVRHPHAIKSIFHFMQIIFLKFLGYQVFSVRLLSLVFGLLTLFYFYRLCKFILQSEKAAAVCTLLLGLDVQFIYASHFARQEIIILFVLVFALNFFLPRIDTKRTTDHVILGIITGLSIGLHPNSFIISLPFVLIYLYNIFVTKKLKAFDLLLYCIVVSVFAAGFIGLSLFFDPNFIENYYKFGNGFDIFDPITSKASELKYFYLKLYYGVSGTYYTPGIKILFILFPAALIISIVRIYLQRAVRQSSKIIAIILSILAINAGLVLVGRYNQTSIVFLFPSFYILVMFSVLQLKKTYRTAFSVLLVLIISLNTAFNVLPWLNTSYDNYLKKISVIINKEDRTLGNLNTEYYFDNGKLYDYRNLAYLKENNISFKEYIEKRQIKYILYSEELDLIYTLRPTWNGVYGNLTYLEEMKHFLDSHCEWVGQFTDAVYGVRITEYIGTKDWNIKIYRVVDNP